jgi:hypothetical protein|tara:strand:+ start:139 stop:546 length:408 start_codon:yes stop_codon:yes gene_type:complete
MTIFDWLNEISYNKRPWSSFNNEDRESFNSYMINRFISMKKDYIDFVNTIQKYPINKETLYNFYCKIVPKRKTFFRYIKPKKSTLNSNLITILAKHFELSEREIKDNYQLIGKDLSKIILQNIGIDDKQIKKLLK